MSKWARVENGVVVEITDIDPAGRFVQEIEQQFVSCGNDVEQGWSYNDGSFEAPMVPEPQVITPPVDQGTADMWEAILALSAKIEALEVK